MDPRENSRLFIDDIMIWEDRNGFIWFSCDHKEKGLCNKCYTPENLRKAAVGIAKYREIQRKKTEGI